MEVDREDHRDFTAMLNEINPEKVNDDMSFVATTRKGLEDSEQNGSSLASKVSRCRRGVHQILTVVLESRQVLSGGVGGTPPAPSP